MLSASVYNLPAANSYTKLAGDSQVMEWGEAITAYRGYLTAIGRPRTTIELRRHQLAHLGRSINLPPGRITEADLIDWFSRQDWSAETRRSYRSGIRGFYAWAVKTGIVQDDPSAEIPQIKVPIAQPRPAPEDVYRRAVAGADPRVALMLRLGAEAGLRRAEIAQVHTRDLRSGADGWQLLVHGKGSRERVVPITDALAGMIAGGSKWLFPSERGGHVSPAWVGELCSQALGPDVTLHQLRHMFASRAYRGTRNLRAVQGLLGHANVSITERYTACDDSERRLAMIAASVA
jgi:integrase/recombinase XerC